MSVQQQIDRINTEVSAQETLLDQALAAIANKAAGGGGGSVETCTVVCKTEAGTNYRPYCISYTGIDDAGNVCGKYVDKNGTASITLENVVCNTALTVYWSAQAQNSFNGFKSDIEFLGWISNATFFNVDATANTTVTVENYTSGIAEPA